MFSSALSSHLPQTTRARVAPLSSYSIGAVGYHIQYATVTRESVSVSVS
jgi:hypothetical protein